MYITESFSIFAENYFEMEENTFHIILKSIVDCDGPEALNDVNIINALSELQMFNDNPAIKYILHAIIADGYLTKLLKKGGWNKRAEILRDNFILETGFQRALTDYVFHCIAFSLDWIHRFPSDDQIDEPSLSVVSKPTSLASRKEWEQYIESLIEWEKSPEEIKKDLGVSMRVNVSLGENKMIFIESTGTLRSSTSVNAIIYGKNLKIKEILLLEFLGLDSFKGSSRNYDIIQSRLSSITKILITVN